MKLSLGNSFSNLTQFYQALNKATTPATIIPNILDNNLCRNWTPPLSLIRTMLSSQMDWRKVYQLEKTLKSAQVANYWLYQPYKVWAPFHRLLESWNELARALQASGARLYPAMLALHWKPPKYARIRRKHKLFQNILLPRHCRTETVVIIVANAQCIRLSELLEEGKGTLLSTKWDIQRSPPTLSSSGTRMEVGTSLTYSGSPTIVRSKSICSWTVCVKKPKLKPRRPRPGTPPWEFLTTRRSEILCYTEDLSNYG